MPPRAGVDAGPAVAVTSMTFASWIRPLPYTMFSPSRHQRFRAIRTRGSSLLLRLVLLIAAWQGPIPWCHSHAPQATAEMGTWLADHLHSHHGPADQQRPNARSSGLLGWHFHADFPTRPVGDEEPSPGQPPAEFPASSVGGLRVADWHSGDRLVALSQWLMPAKPCSAFSSATDRALASAPGSFFDGYAATLPLPLRFSILRC